MAEPQISLPNPATLEFSSLQRQLAIVNGPSASLCLACKGARLLCGKSSCPLLAKVNALLEVECALPALRSEELSGASPPSVFVGRVGYPKVTVGPMLPPVHGDTEIYDRTERWVGLGFHGILRLRYQLVRGKSRLPVASPSSPSAPRLLETLQELALAWRPVDSEARLAKAPRSTLVLDEGSQPFGPSAPLTGFKISSVNADRRLEKVYYDHDLKAQSAVSFLYQAGVPVSRIQHLFSLGMLGSKKRRRLVPTRWSITAVDDIASRALLEEVKWLPPIDEYAVYTYTHLDNVFALIFLPHAWRFEWIEAWFPGTIWNASGSRPELMGDYEGYDGRKTYASVGGCYYSARLAVAEKLWSERRQAAVLALREIRSGYLFPVGVWNVRESIREALRRPPRRFSSFPEALSHAIRHLRIPLETWMSASVMLKTAEPDLSWRRQVRLEGFLHTPPPQEP